MTESRVENVVRIIPNVSLKTKIEGFMSECLHKLENDDIFDVDNPEVFVKSISMLHSALASIHAELCNQTDCDERLVIGRHIESYRKRLLNADLKELVVIRSILGFLKNLRDAVVRDAFLRRPDMSLRDVWDFGCES